MRNRGRHLNRYRRKHPLYGYFLIKVDDTHLHVVSSGPANTKENPFDWEHVSVSHPLRCPSWLEMCEIKDLFFSETETVVQFHPQQSEYVNIHAYCLHLWRNAVVPIPLPPLALV